MLQSDRCSSATFRLSFVRCRRRRHAMDGMRCRSAWRVSMDLCAALLVLFAGARMIMWPVDKRVGNVKNEGAELAELIAI